MMFSARQAPFTITASCLMALQPLLLTLSKGPDGYFEYSVPSATMITEVLKLGFSGIALTIQLVRQPELRSKTLSDRPFLEFMQFLVPSAIYFANNNLAFVILQERPCHPFPWTAACSPAPRGALPSSAPPAL